MQRVAIDIGSGLTKVRSDKEKLSFQSLAGPRPSESGFILAEKFGRVSFEGKEFFIDESANSNIAPSNLIHTMSEKWAGCDGWRALLYGALSRVCPAGTSEVMLTTGLPIKYFEKERAEILACITGNHSFKVNGEDFFITIDEGNAWVIPQAVGLFCAETDDISSVNTVCYLDIGTFTTGWATFENGSLRNWQSGGAEIGVGHVKKDLERAIKSEFGIENLSSAEIENALRSGKLQTQTGCLNIDSLIKSVVKSHGDKLISQLRKAIGGGSTALIRVGGGGAGLFLNSVKEYSAGARLVRNKDMAFGVVDGFYSFMRVKSSGKLDVEANVKVGA